MKYNIIHIYKASIFLKSLFFIVSILLFFPNTSVADNGDFWYSDTRWAVNILVELDADGLIAANKYVEKANDTIGEDWLSVDSNSCAFIGIRNLMNRRVWHRAYIYANQKYDITFGLYVNDINSPNGVCLIGFDREVQSFKGKTEVKIKSEGPTKIEFNRQISITDGEGKSGVIKAKGEWIRDRDLFICTPLADYTWPDDYPFYSGDDYYRSPDDPIELHLTKTRQTRNIIFEGGVPVNPKNEFKIKVNFENADYQALFGGDIIEVYEYHGELIEYIYPESPVQP